MTGPDAPMIAVVGLVVIAAALWLMAGLLIPPDRVACPNIDAGRAPLAQDGREGVWLVNGREIGSEALAGNGRRENGH